MPPPAESPVVIFAGPTLAGSPALQALARRHRLRGPVRRFDVAKLVERSTRPGVLVLIDGVFHDTLAVGHAEIREALVRGWRVWGLSSMGAIRAREMWSFGVRGFGRVFRHFMAKDDFQDDEVALLHESGPPYRAVTVPLIHLRVAIGHLVTCGAIEVGDGLAVLEELKSLWFGERSLHVAVQALLKRARSPQQQDLILTEMRDFARFAIKTADARQFLAQATWNDRQPEE